MNSMYATMASSRAQLVTDCERILGKAGLAENIVSKLYFGYPPEHGNTQKKQRNLN